MVNKKLIPIRIIAISVAVGGVIFLIYIALFNNLILASIIATTTIIFTIVVGGLTILNMRLRQSYQSQIDQLVQMRQRFYGITPDDPNIIVEPTPSNVSYQKDEQEPPPSSPPRPRSRMTRTNLPPSRPYIQRTRTNSSPPRPRSRMTRTNLPPPRPRIQKIWGNTCPRCRRKTLEKKQMKRKNSFSYLCSNCGWQWLEIQVQKKSSRSLD